MGLAGTRAGMLVSLNEASLQARLWTKPGYRYRPASQHDQAGHEFRSSHPYFGWVHVRVGDIDLAMFSNNDDGVAMVYHAFGPDSYEAASVAAWAALASQSKSIADIGSFTGLYALLAQAAAPSSSVLAIEPNSAIRARLYMNLVANGSYPKIKVAPYAVSDSLSTLPLHVAWGPDILDTGSSLHAPVDANPIGIPIRTEIVTAAPIDALIRQFGYDQPDLVKIDVEGLEDVALAGASTMLAERPTIFLEIQGSEKFSACYAVLEKYNYRVFAIEDELIKLIPYQGEEIPTWFKKNVGARVMNFLCVSRREHMPIIEAALLRIQDRL